MKQTRKVESSLVETQRPLESLSSCTSDTVAMGDMEGVDRTREGLASMLRRAKGGLDRRRGHRALLREDRVAMAI